MQMKNLKMSTRLVIGFGSVLLLLVVVAILGFSGMYKLNAAMREITDVNNVETTLANRMKSTVLLRDIAIRNIVLLRDNREMASEIERIKTQEQIYADAYLKLGQLLSSKTSSAKAQALYDALKDDEAQAQPLMTKGIKLGQANDADGALRVLMDEVRPRQAIWLGRLTDLAALEESNNEQAAAQAKTIYETLSTISLTAAALAILFGVLAAWLIVRGILRQLGGDPSEAQHTARQIAQGDLTVRMSLAAGDQDSLMASLESMRVQLSHVVSGIKASAESIAVTADEIARGNLDLSSRTEQQAASLEETASSMEQLTSTVQQNSDNARQGNILAARASNTAQQGGAVVQKVVQTMRDISASSSQIAEIISVVEGIAFQTNILALNAAVEAARAGEQGRGFAVVATEVRTLAQRSATAAKEIRDLIATSITHVNHGSQLVEDAGQTMQAILTSVQSVADLMNEISSASSEQSSGIEQINIAVTQMDQVTQQNAALVEQAATAAQAMAAQSHQLRTAVAVFSVDMAGVVRAPLKTLPQLQTMREPVLLG
jgi:methyl-accepting chemotaxis protein